MIYDCALSERFFSNIANLGDFSIEAIKKSLKANNILGKNALI